MMSAHDDLAANYQLKKKIIPGDIDVHPTENAIVVNYTVQASILGENGQPVAGDRKLSQKIIRIKTLTPSTNLTTIAQEVVEKCKLIHPSKTREVEQVLYYLLQRQAATDDDIMSDREWLKRQLEDQKREEERGGGGPGGGTSDLAKQQEAPSIANIESYIEGLYEEIPDKIKSTRNVLELARDPANLDALVGNDALMSALSRVLREDNRKSTPLNTNIITIFYCFSQFAQYQDVITAHKVGDMCLRIVEMELRRFGIWCEDLKGLEGKAEKDKASAAASEVESRKFQAMVGKQDQLLFVSFNLLFNLSNDLSIEPKMVKRGIIKYLVEMLARATPELVVLAINFLKRLSVIRDNKDEIIGMGDGFISKLDRLLPSEHEALQALLLRLTLNLIHDAYFRTQLHRAHFLPKLISHLQTISLANSNALKRQIAPTLQILYMLSLDEKHRAAFANAETTALVLRLLLSQPASVVSSTTSSTSSTSGTPATATATTAAAAGQGAERLPLMALAVNLANNTRTAPLLLADNSLKFLMKRVMKTRDPLLWKMLRGMAGCTGAEGRMAFLDYIDDIMHLLLKSTSQPDTLVEILGLLASLTIPDFDFAKLAEAYGLLAFVQGKLQAAVDVVVGAGEAIGHGDGDGDTGTAGLADDDDITLEVVVLLGTMANDENVGPLVSQTQIPQILMELMIAKEDDDEMILQIIYCAYQFLLIQSTRAVLLDDTEIVSYLIDLLYDRNVEIRKMCDVCLDLISEFDDEYLLKIRHQKFHYHNSEWLHRIAQSTTAASHPELMYMVDDHVSGGGGDPTASAAGISRDAYDAYAAGRRGAIFDPKEPWSDSDSEVDGDDFGKGMVVGGNNALLDGF
ncbi:kinesin-associated protein-domain-containing protein [Geranomyces variabilis]|nr:kinesin-associated protein-domain-containing protein [Geranomyces variabilis]